MSKVMFSLPNQLVIRMRAVIPSGERSEVLVSLLEKEIKARENDLYKKAAALEACSGLKQETDIWDHEFGEDGLNDV